MPSHFWKINDVEVKYDTPDETEIRRDAHEVVQGVAEKIKQDSATKYQPATVQANYDIYDQTICYGQCAPNRETRTARDIPDISPLASFFFGGAWLPVLGVVAIVVLAVMKFVK